MTETPPTAIGTAIPLLFSYQVSLFGNGFVVEVKANNGRALCVREADGFWMYGINPGAMAAFGDDLDAAHAEFRHTFSGNLKEMAAEAKSFDEFRASVTEFVTDTNRGYERAWLTAVEAVRRNEVDVAELPRVAAESPLSIEVSIKEHFNAADNSANLELARAA
jgi:hypothetical protein